MDGWQKAAAVVLVVCVVGLAALYGVVSHDSDAKSSRAMVPASPSVLPRGEFPSDIAELATCTAATLKMGDVKLWNRWFAETERRYGVIYPDRDTDAIDSYATERVLDKRRSLEASGIASGQAFVDYFNKNCK